MEIFWATDSSAGISCGYCSALTGVILELCLEGASSYVPAGWAECMQSFVAAIIERFAFGSQLVPSVGAAGAFGTIARGAPCGPKGARALNAAAEVSVDACD